MTRINTGINPKDLSRQHLLAELREIKRIPNLITSGKAVVKNIPETFRLGPGHVKFFYDKCGHLLDRYHRLRNEALRRGYNVSNFSGAWDDVPQHLMNDWRPTPEARTLIQNRIKERTS